MRVAIAGGHGKIGFRLGRLLVQRGDQAVGLIRRQDQATVLGDAGIEPVVCDLEQAPASEIAAALRGVDAVVFAAGAGPGSGEARKDTMDRAGAALLATAAQDAGVRRYVLVSSMGIDRANDPGVEPVFAAYLRAKGASEVDLQGRDLDWTIVRPGRLTDEPGTGQVALVPPPLPSGAVPRDDVAAVLLALLDRPATSGKVLELTSGGVDARPVADAVAEVAG